MGGVERRDGLDRRVTVMDRGGEGTRRVNRGT